MPKGATMFEESKHPRQSGKFAKKGGGFKGLMARLKAQSGPKGGTVPVNPQQQGDSVIDAPPVNPSARGGHGAEPRDKPDF